MKKLDKIKLKFFLINLAKGIALLIVLLIAYRFFINYINIKNFTSIDYLEDLSTAFIFVVFFFSEIIFGIIPPEFFMIWILNHKDPEMYPFFILALSTISYFAGIFAFLFGKYLHETTLYNLMKKYIIGRYERKINMYGGVAIIVAALTPLPFSGTSAVIGAIGYDYKKYFLFALSRFIRYGLYGYIIFLATP